MPKREKWNLYSENGDLGLSKETDSEAEMCMTVIYGRACSRTVPVKEAGRIGQREKVNCRADATETIIGPMGGSEWEVPDCSA